MLIEDYLDENIHDFNLRNNGEATGECPICGKGSNHFYIHIDEDDRYGKWICFSCQEKGNLWKLIGHLEGISLTSAKRWWIEKNQDKPPTTIDKIRKKVDNLRTGRRSIKTVNTALPYGFKRIKRRRPKMLADRGVLLKTAYEYRLGYCPEGDFAGRIVFPIFCPLGRSWTARAVNDVKPKYWGGDGAGRLLYGWDVAFRNGVPSQLVVCEGPMDVLSLHQAGIPAVALMSKTINETRAALLRSVNTSLLIVLDAEARVEALKVSRALDSADIVSLNTGDPGDSQPDVLVQAVSNVLGLTSATCAVFRDRVQRLRQKSPQIKI